jgi:hypothetical protein
MKIIQITLILIFSLNIISCSPDPYKDCYKKNYKYHKDQGKPDHIAARIAKGACDKKN